MDTEDNATSRESVKIDANPEGFRIFLDRLDSDEQRAWEKYADLHARLAKQFEWKRPGRDAATLADQTIERVITHLQEPREIQDVIRYCFGVARYIALEDSRASKEVPLDPTKPDPKAPSNPEFDLEEKQLKQCYKACLLGLRDDDRSFFFKYFTETPPREQLAVELDISEVAMRQRASRLRRRLKACIEECKGKGPA